MFSKSIQCNGLLLYSVLFLAIMATPSIARVVRVYDWELIHMDVDNGQNATNLDFTLWQKEDNIEVLGWDYKLKQRRIDGGKIIAEDEGNSNIHDDSVFRSDPQNQQDFPGMHDKGKNHAADVSITGLNIPKCTWLYLKTSLHLTKWNTLRKRDIKWTFDENPNPQPPDNAGLPPDEGFIFSDYVPDLNHPGKYFMTYTIANDDRNRWFKVQNLAFLLDSFNDPVEDPEEMMYDWSGWIAYSGGNFELGPRTNMEIVLDNLDQVPWLYAKMEKQEITGPGGADIGDPIITIQIHETPEPMTIILLSLGSLIFLHRRSG